MARTWTDEQKAKQAALIRTWKPWEQSTGPRTDRGKAISSGNRERALQAARDDVEKARRNLFEAVAKLERLTG